MKYTVCQRIDTHVLFNINWDKIVKYLLILLNENKYVNIVYHVVVVCYKLVCKVSFSLRGSTLLTQYSAGVKPLLKLRWRFYVIFSGTLLCYVWLMAWVVYLLSVCLLSITSLHSGQRLALFSNIFEPPSSSGTQAICINILSKNSRGSVWNQSS